MDGWRKDNRREAVITDIEGLVPKDHILRKVEKVKRMKRRIVNPLSMLCFWLAIGAAARLLC